MDIVAIFVFRKESKNTLLDFRISKELKLFVRNSTRTKETTTPDFILSITTQRVFNKETKNEMIFKKRGEEMVYTFDF